MINLPGWSLLLVGEALKRPWTSPSEFGEALQLDSPELETGLEHLVADGLIESDGDAYPRYALTAKGSDLYGVIRALDEWSSQWDLEVPTPATLVVESDDDSVTRPAIEISVLGTFELRIAGQTVAGLSMGSQRLLVFLVLNDRAVSRLAMAGALWPEVSEERAGLSLRAALSRLDLASRHAVLVTSAGLGLASGVAVDLRAAQALAHRLIAADAPLPGRDLDDSALALLSRELLPDWYDDWVLTEAEDWRQLRLNALEAMALVHLIAGRFSEASAAARAAMKVEPMRESPHAILIRVHLANGNQSEALRVYTRYCALLMSALYLEPTPKLTDLVAGLTTP